MWMVILLNKSGNPGNQNDNTYLTMQYKIKGPNKCFLVVIELWHCWTLFESAFQIWQLSKLNLWTTFTWSLWPKFSSFSYRFSPYLFRCNIKLKAQINVFLWLLSCDTVGHCLSQLSKSDSCQNWIYERLLHGHFDLSFHHFLIVSHPIYLDKYFTNVP